jgi:hypothetical protein
MAHADPKKKKREPSKATNEKESIVKKKIIYIFASFVTCRTTFLLDPTPKNFERPMEMLEK